MTRILPNLHISANENIVFYRIQYKNVPKLPAQTLDEKRGSSINEPSTVSRDEREITKRQKEKKRNEEGKKEMKEGKAQNESLALSTSP